MQLFSRLTKLRQMQKKDQMVWKNETHLLHLKLFCRLSLWTVFPKYLKSPSIVYIAIFVY